MVEALQLMSLAEAQGIALHPTVKKNIRHSLTAPRAVREILTRERADETTSGRPVDHLNLSAKPCKKSYAIVSKTPAEKNHCCVSWAGLCSGFSVCMNRNTVVCTGDNTTLNSVTSAVASSMLAHAHHSLVSRF